MADSSLTHTTADMRQDIVCPLCLKIMIASKGRLGAIQSYRCQPKPNMGGWETRPQKDKWAEDFFRVLNAKKNETVTLTDGETVMNGLDRPSDTRFLFTHEDGMGARKVAMKYVVAGELRAPRNWDKVWASEAGISLDELKDQFPELYETKTRSSQQEAEDQEIEVLGEGFLSEEDEGMPHVETDTLDEEDEQAIHEEEEQFEEEPAYSVVAELGLEDELENMSTGTPDSPQHHKGPVKQITIKKPGSSQLTRIYNACTWIKAEMEDGDTVDFYKVTDPNTGKTVWLHEGMNECFANLQLKVTK